MGIFDFAFKAQLEKVEASTRDSFNKVRQDTEALGQWVSYLYKENQSLRDQIRRQHQHMEEHRLALNELKVTLHHVPKTSSEIKRIVDTHFDIEPLIRRLKHIEQRIELLEVKRSRFELPRPAAPLADRRPSVHTRPRTALHEKVMKRLVKNSKDYIKNMISNLVHKYGRISAIQLREIIVEEQGLTSKSSFYRIVDEMEREGVLQEIGDNKNKTFVSPTVS